MQIESYYSSLNKSSSAVNDNRKIRYSLPLLPTPTQPPSVLLNNRRVSRRQTCIDLPKAASNTSDEQYKQSKLQIDSQEQYEHTMQLLAMLEQITFLSNKLIYTEQKICKWKQRFLELQSSFQEIMAEKDKTTEELKTTRRMLQESEHIRARWFIKSSSSMPLVQQETNSQKDTCFYGKSASLPKNTIFRFLKFNNPRKSASLSKTPAV